MYLSYILDKRDKLTDEEKQRDSFGDSLLFTYDENIITNYPSSLPGVFPGNVFSSPEYYHY